MTLALAATRTRRIRQGPGVMIPSLRHPMVTASAIATLVSLVGKNRVVIGIGTGFTGRRAMGQKPLRWQDMPRMVDDIRRLLAGDTVELEGAAARMLHWPGQAPNRPIEVPFVLGVNGPKGLETAAAMRCGVITSRPRPDAAYDKSLDVILLGFGTILDPGETLSSPRVINTVGPGAMVSYHAFLEQHDARLDGFPNAKRFIELANAVDRSQRHLALHSGHLTELNAIDRQVIIGEVLSIAPLVCRPAELPERLVGLARQASPRSPSSLWATSPASCRRSRMQLGFRRRPEQSSRPCSGRTGQCRDYVVARSWSSASAASRQVTTCGRLIRLNRELIHDGHAARSSDGPGPNCSSCGPDRRAPARRLGRRRDQDRATWLVPWRCCRRQPSRLRLPELAPQQARDNAQSQECGGPRHLLQTGGACRCCGRELPLRRQASARHRLRGRRQHQPEDRLW